MDNLFSFPAAALSAASSSSSTPSEAPASDASSRTTPTPNGLEMAEAIENVPAASTAASSSDLHVRLKMLDERVFDVYVDRAVAVAEFRATVERVTAVPATLQRLIYRGKLLKDGAVLASYDIQDGHTVHLVAKPATSPRGSSSPSSSPPSTTTATATASTSTDESFGRDDERERLNRFIGRSRERLRQTMDDEQRARNEMFGVPRPTTPLATGTSRVRRPGAGDPTGDAWNLAVLREALGQQSDRIPARPSNRDPTTVHDSLRQGNEQREMAANDSPADTAAAMGLDPATSGVQPNLDYISQGIMTLRTVLSTAPLPPRENGGMPDLAVEEDLSERSMQEEPMQSESQAEVATPSVSPRGSPRRGRRRFFVGQWLDVKDTVNQWLECTVMDMTEDKVLVHYHGWPSRWDEWLDFDSDRIAAFRTRTQHTQSGVQLSPAPSTRLPNAPSVGESDVRRIVPQIRDLMEEVLPYVDQLATLCENDDQDRDEDDEYRDDRDRRQEELSEMAHLLAPFFDRFGRLLVDSARQLDPLLHPNLRHEERRRRLLRARGSAPNRQSPVPSDATVEDSALGIRDLITPVTRPSHEPQNARRSIDVHIHAIVAPSSLSSLASLARLGTAIAGAMGNGDTSRSSSLALEPQRQSSNELEDAFGLPRLRPLQGGSGDRSILPDANDSDDEDARHTDTSRTPLLSSFRRSASRSSARTTSNSQREGERVLRQRDSSVGSLNDFMSDQLFGTTSFSEDSDDMDDPVAHAGFGRRDNGQDDVVQYQEIPSPIGSEIHEHRTSENDRPRIGVIPEILEAERRLRERQQNQDTSSQDDSDRSSSSSPSTTNSSGFPTFLEVMRRTLSGVRNFGFSSSSSSMQSETSPSAAPSGTSNQRTTRSESDSSSADSSSVSEIEMTPSTDPFADARAVLQSNDPVLAFSRLRQPSSVSSIEEDLDSVD